jgi:hypothetical protein
MSRLDTTFWPTAIRPPREYTFACAIAEWTVWRIPAMCDESRSLA